MNDTSPTSTSDDSALKQEKSWSELTDSEKIERMREIVKSLANYTIPRIQRQTIKLERDFYNHSHNEKGEIVTKVERYDSENSELGGILARNSNPGEVYF